MKMKTNNLMKLGPFSGALVMIFALAGCAVESETTNPSEDGTSGLSARTHAERGVVVDDQEEEQDETTTRRDEPMLVHVLPFYCAGCAQPGVPQPRELPAEER